MPAELWAWSEHGPTPSLEAYPLVLEAWSAVGDTPEETRYYIRHHVANEAVLFARGAAHIMARYAQKVDAEFQVLMRSLFGDRFCKAPVKKVARMEPKIQMDLEQEEPDLAPIFAEPESAQHDARARAAFYGLGDLVRGSVVAKGSEMLEVLGKLRDPEQAKDDKRRLEVWRIKNTHHADAKVVGGYRDIKVLGKFSAGELSMVVEVQIIDATFLEVKKYMHKVYAIERGDF